MARNIASSTESSDTVTRVSPASASACARWRSSEPLVVIVRSSMPSMPARRATSWSTLRRSSGSPPVSRIFVTPRPAKTRASRSISSNDQHLVAAQEPEARTEDLLRHAVGAAEVAAVGERDAQVAQRAVQTVFHRPAVYGGWRYDPEGDAQAVLEVVRRVARGGEPGDPERVDVDLDPRAVEHLADRRPHRRIRVGLLGVEQRAVRPPHVRQHVAGRAAEAVAQADQLLGALLDAEPRDHPRGGRELAEPRQHELERRLLGGHAASPAMRCPCSAFSARRGAYSRVTCAVSARWTWIPGAATAAARRVSRGAAASTRTVAPQYQSVTLVVRRPSPTGEARRRSQRRDRTPPSRPDRRSRDPP